MTERSVTHSSFTLERTYDAAPARVFSAWADPAEKRQWWGGGQPDLELDFQVGGREYSAGTVEDMRYSYEARFQDIVQDERIVYTYELHLNDARVSVSVVTVELKPAGNGTRLVYTEQGAFLDGLDDPKLRENGTGSLLDGLASHLAGEPASA
jgi:uncharacterized protein YndB with AHSA1/START domain